MRKRIKYNYLIKSIQQLWPEMSSNLQQYSKACQSTAANFVIKLYEKDAYTESRMNAHTSCMTFSLAVFIVVWPDNAASKCSAPRLDVMIMTVFEKLTVRPCPSVSLPSSSI
jgi:hypothetical protein